MATAKDRSFASMPLNVPIVFVYGLSISPPIAWNSLGGQTVVCTGINDKHLLVSHINEQLEESTIKRILKEKLQIHSSAVQVKYVPAMPLTPNEKIDYPAVMQNAERQTQNA